MLSVLLEETVRFRYASLRRVLTLNAYPDETAAMPEDAPDVGSGKN